MKFAGTPAHESEVVLRRSALIILSMLFSIYVAVPACAMPPMVRFSARFTPDRPGASTTIHLGFKIGTSANPIPPPLTSVMVSLPPHVGVLQTTLGQVVCEPWRLEAMGETGCSTNALMGRGHAVAELVFGNTIVRDAADVSMFMGVPVAEHTTMVFLAVSKSPVVAEFIFHGALLPNPQSLDGAIFQTTIPLISSVPGGPNVSVVSVESTLGPENITYYRTVHRKKIAFRPEGLTLPRKCPRGGLEFAAVLGFADGTMSKVESRAPCGG